MWLTPGPLADEWDIPSGNGPKFLVKYLYLTQAQTYGTFYTQQSRTILLRNMKLLCAEYTEETLKRAIALGCTKSKFPFSTKFVKDMAECVLASRSSPMQKFYQNKS